MQVSGGHLLPPVQTLVATIIFSQREKMLIESGCRHHEKKSFVYRTKDFFRTKCALRHDKRTFGASVCPQSGHCEPVRTLAWQSPRKTQHFIAKNQAFFLKIGGSPHQPEGWFAMTWFFDSLTTHSRCSGNEWFSPFVLAKALLAPLQLFCCIPFELLPRIFVGYEI